jgi:subtilisin family serine protease
VITVNFGSATDPETLYYRAGHLVEFVARGQDIEVAWLAASRKKVTGSSFSAPHVAGLLARLISGSPSISPAQAKALLQRLAEPLPETSGDRRIGDSM